MSVEFGAHSVAGQNIAGLQRALARQTLRFTVTSTRINKGLCQCPAHVKAFEKLSGEQLDADHQRGSHDVECLSEFPEPAFRKVEIHSTQAIERQEIVPHGPIVATVPCRADSAGVGMDYRHFINGENVTSAATQGQIALSFLDSMSNIHPLWSTYGISRIVPINLDLSEDCWQGWIRLQTNGLPPPKQSLEKSILRLISLDVFWTSDNPDYLKSRLIHADIATTHSPETMALMMGIVNIFRGLAREYPLIFSPRDINSYIRRSRNITSWSNSLFRISGRAVNPRVKQSLSATFERISTLYPGAPKDDKQLLVECALESVIYAGIKKGYKLHGGGKIDQDEIERQYWNHCGEKSCAIEDDDQNEDISVISHTANCCTESQDINIHGASRQVYSPDNSLSDFCVPSDEDDEMEYNNNHWSLSDDVKPYSMDLGEGSVGTRQMPSHISRADSSIINFSDPVFSSDSTFISPMYR